MPRVRTDQRSPRRSLGPNGTAARRAMRRARAGAGAGGDADESAEEEGQLPPTPPKKKRKSLPSAASASASARPYYDIYGKDAVASIELNREFIGAQEGGCVKISDVHELLLWLLTEDLGQLPKWCVVRNKPLLSGPLVLLHIDGFGSAACTAPPAAASADGGDEWRPLAASLALPGAVSVALRGPGDKRSVFDAGQALLTCSARTAQTLRKRLRRLAAAPSPPVAAVDGDAAAGPPSVAEERYQVEDLVLSVEQQRENNYPPYAPQPQHSARPEFVSSDNEGRGAAPGNGPLDKLLALDCEMVITDEGFELARVSLVAADERVLLDELVLPVLPVRNYNTRYSGIDEAKLAGVTTTLAQARERVLALLHPQHVLVGHSLENDLLALRLLHGRVIDTAVLFPSGRGGGSKQSLRALAQKHLRTDVQAAAHDSVEDALTALRLVKLRLATPRGSPLPGDDEAGAPSLLAVLSAPPTPVSSAWLAPPSQLAAKLLEGARTSTHALADDGALEQALLKLLADGRTRFCMCQLRAPHNLMYRHFQQRHEQLQALAPDAPLPSLEPTTDERQALQAVLSEADARIARVAAALPRNGLLLVVSGGGNSTAMRVLHKRRGLAMQANTSQPALGSRPNWDDQLERQLETAAAQARAGLALLYVKHL